LRTCKTRPKKTIDDQDDGVATARTSKHAVDLAIVARAHRGALGVVSQHAGEVLTQRAEQALVDGAICTLVAVGIAVVVSKQRCFLGVVCVAIIAQQRHFAVVGDEQIVLGRVTVIANVVRFFAVAVGGVVADCFFAASRCLLLARLREREIASGALGPKASVEVDIRREQTGWRERLAAACLELVRRRMGKRGFEICTRLLLN
jgi:predicted regulator of Ras-like GTPase activity (Roadblock/LC7/MglB family)